MKEYLGWSALEEIASWVKKYFARKNHTHSVDDIEKFGDEVGQIIALLVVVDTALNIASNNAVSNATVTRELEDIKQKIMAGGGGNLDYDIIATEVLKKLKILTAESEIDPSADLTDTIVGGELFRTVSNNLKNDISTLLDKFDSTGKLKEAYFDFNGQFQAHIKDFHRDLMTGLVNEPYDDIVQNSQYTIKSEHMPYPFADLFGADGKIKSEFLPTSSGGGGDDIDMVKVVDKIYPVGSIWIGMSYDDPRDLFGHHTKWKRLENRFLLGFDGGSKRVGYRGGEAEHTLTVDEMPSHTHNLNRPWSDGKGGKKSVYAS